MVNLGSFAKSILLFFVKNEFLYPKNRICSYWASKSANKRLNNRWTKTENLDQSAMFFFILFLFTPNKEGRRK